MAKTKISEYDSTAANNTDIDSINIAEGCAPSGINNAIREQMAHLKDGLGAGTPVFLDQTNNRVGIGTTSPSAPLDVELGTTGTIAEFRGDSTDILNIDGDSNAITLDARNVGSLNFEMQGTEAMRIDSSGNVGIGTTSDQKASATDEGIFLVPGGNSSFTANGVPLVINRMGTGGNNRSNIEFRNNGNVRGEIGTVGAANGLYFTTGGTERMRIDSSGRVGIGTSSPNYGLHLNDSADATVRFQMTNSNTGTGTGDGFQIIQNGSSQSNKVNLLNYENSNLGIWTNNTERMIIESDGDVLVATTDDGVSGAGFVVKNEGTYGHIILKKTFSGNATGVHFYHNGSAVGTINYSNSSTTYNTSSDYRLKENVTDVTDGITRVKQLSPKRFNFISDADTTVDGFLAHEAATVVPEAITGEKDAMRDEEYEVSAATGDIYTPAVDAVVDEEGNEVSAAIDEVIHSSNVEQPETLEEGQLWRETTAAVMDTRSVPDYQGIDQSKLVPLLTAALQEAIAKIETLETRVAALEG